MTFCSVIKTFEASVLQVRKLSLVLSLWVLLPYSYFIEFSATARSQSLTSKLYDQSNGLTDLDPVSILQTKSGIIFVNTQGASFISNGHDFLPLGKDQGLPGTTTFQDMEIGPDPDTIIAAQDGQIFIARIPTLSPLQNLHFFPIRNASHAPYPHFRLLTAYDNNVVAVAGEKLQYLDLHSQGGPKFTPLPLSLQAADHLAIAPIAVHGQGKSLWISGADGRICVLGQISRCWGPSAGLPNRRWGGFLDGPNGSIVARDSDTLVTIDPVNGKISLDSLPDVNPAFEAYTSNLRIQKLSDGDLMTQSLHGVVVRHQGVWRVISIVNGQGSIWAMLYDKSGVIWLGVAGEGIRQAFGYKSVESWTAASGLSNNMVWGITRQIDGRLWIATDGGLDELSADGSIHPRFESRTVQSLISGRTGILWVMIDANTLERIDTRTGIKSQIQLRDMSAFRTDIDGKLWIATGNGLFSIKDNGENLSSPILQSSSSDYFSDLTLSGDGSIWLSGSGALWRKSPEGTVEEVVKQWPEQGVEAEIVAHAADGTVWVGTANGLFHVDTSASVPKIEKISASLLPSQNINAMLIDHKQTLWVGTSNGLAIFRNHKWVSVDTSTGLIGNDVDQESLFEDTDGTIWIGTSKGVSHILNPDNFFQPQILYPKIFQTRANGRLYRGERLPYGASHLSVQLGLVNYPETARVHYKYKLDLPDTEWIDLASSRIDYPSLPWGHHRLLIEAYDPLTHVSSDPIFLEFNMMSPWWLQPWAIMLAVMIAIVAMGATLRLRTLYLLKQRKALQQQVLARTEELERAHDALQAIASQDALTGLLNRGAIQNAIARALANSGGHTLMICVMDIDFFKKINDTHGHLIGDAVLITLARRLRNQLKSGELIGRFGGEEYVLAIPNTDYEGFTRIKSILSSATVDPITYAELQIKVTVSAGVAQANIDDTWDTIIARADNALYRAKRGGRNLILQSARKEFGDDLVLSSNEVK